jgi:hypothetical protein
MGTDIADLQCARENARGKSQTFVSNGLQQMGRWCGGDQPAIGWRRRRRTTAADVSTLTAMMGLLSLTRGPDTGRAGRANYTDFVRLWERAG